MDTLYKYMVGCPQPCVYFVISDKEQMKLYSLLASINKNKSPSRAERVHLKVVEKDKILEAGTEKVNWFEKIMEEPTCVVYCTDWQKYKVESSKSLTSEFISDPNLVDILSGSIGVPSNLSKEEKKKDKKDKLDRFDEIDLLEHDLIKITSKNLEKKIREDIDKFLVPSREINSKKSIPHKFLFLVTLNKNIKNPNKVIGSLKSLDPSEVCAVCVSCGMTDIHSKLEKLEQMIYETSLSYYEKKIKKITKNIINLKAQITGTLTEVTELYYVLLNFKIAYFSEILGNRKDAFNKYNLCWNSIKQMNSTINLIDKTSLSFFICLRMFDYFFGSGDISSCMTVYVEYKKYLERLILDRYRGLYYNLMYIINYFIAYKLEKLAMADEKNSNVLLQQSSQYYKWAVNYVIQLRKHIVDMNHPLDDEGNKDFYNKDKGRHRHTSDELRDDFNRDDQNNDSYGNEYRDRQSRNGEGKLTNKYNKLNVGGYEDEDDERTKVRRRKYHMPRDFNNIFYYEDADYHQLHDDSNFKSDEQTENELELREDDEYELHRLMEDDRKFEVESRKLILKSFTLYKNLNYSKNLVYSYSILGDSFYLSSNYKESLKIYLNTLKHVLYNINFNQMYSTVIRKYSDYRIRSKSKKEGKDKDKKEKDKDKKGKKYRDKEEEEDEGIYEKLSKGDSMDYLEVVNMLMYSELTCNELQLSMYFKLLCKVMLSLINLLNVKRIPTILYQMSDLTYGEEENWWSCRSCREENKEEYMDKGKESRENYEKLGKGDRKFSSSTFSSRFRLDDRDYEDNRYDRSNSKEGKEGYQSKDKKEKEKDKKSKKEKSEREKSKRDLFMEYIDQDREDENNREGKESDEKHNESKEEYSSSNKGYEAELSNLMSEEERDTYKLMLIKCLITFISIYNKRSKMNKYLNYVVNLFSKSEGQSSLSTSLSSSFGHSVERNREGKDKKEKDKDKKGKKYRDKEEEEDDGFYDLDEEDEDLTRDNQNRSRNINENHSSTHNNKDNDLRSKKEKRQNLVSGEGSNLVGYGYGNINTGPLESYVLLSKNTKSQYMYKYQEGTIEIIVNFNTDVKMDLTFYEGFLDTSEGPLSFYYHDSELISNAFIIYTNHINGNGDSEKFDNYGSNSNGSNDMNNKDGTTVNNRSGSNDRNEIEKEGRDTDYENNRDYRYESGRSESLVEQMNKMSLYRSDRSVELPHDTRVILIIQLPFYPIKGFKINGIIFKSLYREKLFVNSIMLTYQYVLNKHFKSLDMVNLGYYSGKFELEKHFSNTDNRYEEDNEKLSNLIYLSFNDIYKDFLVMDNYITMDRLELVRFMNLNLKIKVFVKNVVKNFMSPITIVLLYNSKFRHLYRRYRYELQISHDEFYLLGKNDEDEYMLFKTELIEFDFNDSVVLNFSSTCLNGGCGYNNEEKKEGKESREDEYSNSNKGYKAEEMNIKLNSSDSQPRYMMYSHLNLVRNLKDSDDEVDEDVMNYINIYKNNNDIYVMYGLICVNNAVNVKTQVPFNLYIKNFNTNKERKDYRYYQENRSKEDNDLRSKKEGKEKDSEDNTLLYNKLLDVYSNDMSNININYKYYNNFDMLLYIHLVNNTDITYDLLKINILYNNHILTIDDKNKLYGYNDKIDSHQNLNFIYIINNYRDYNLNRKDDDSEEVNNIIQIQLSKNIRQKLYYPFNHMKNFLKYTINKFIKIDTGNDKIQLVLKHKSIVNLGTSFQMEAEIINTTDETMEYEVTLNDENKKKDRTFIVEGPLNVSLVGAPKSSDTLKWTLIPISCDPFKTPSVLIVNKLDSSRKTMTKSRTSQIYVVP